MGPAKGREAQRGNIRRVICETWETEYQPEHFTLAVLMPNLGLSVMSSDEAPLREELFACAESVDKGWLRNPELIGRGHSHTDLSHYPIMAKYFGPFASSVGRRPACTGLTSNRMAARTIRQRRR
jgi:hypothetical protein